MKTTLFTNTLFFTVCCNLGFSQQKIVASDRGTNDSFGISVNTSETTAIIGAYTNKTDANNENSIDNAGAAYVYELDNNSWIEKQKLVASDRYVDNLYGSYVCINDDIIIVSAPYADGLDASSNVIASAGGVYIYTKDINNTWVEIQKLVASDATESSLFGTCVSMSGNFVFVSAPSSWCEAVGTTPYSNSGAVYVFEKNHTTGLWEEKQKLMSSDRATGDNFGKYISSTENYLAIGAYSEDEDENGNNTLSEAGSVYIFEKDTNGDWVETQKIVAPDRAPEDFFGHLLSIHENTLLVSSIGNDTDENFTNQINETGAAYIFERDSGNGKWNFSQKIIASDRNQKRMFGTALDLNSSKMVIAAYYKTEGSSLSTYGSVYVFERNSSGTWEERKILEAFDGYNGDKFGYELSVSDNHIAIGSPHHDKDLNGENHKSNAGAAYVYNISELLSVQDNQFSNSLETTIFPNPNNGAFTLNFGKRINGTITITDVLGKVRHTETFISDNLKINLGLPKGVYFANVKADEGNSVVKFVVE